MTWHRLKAAILDSLRMNRSVMLVMVGYVAAALLLGHLTGFEVALQIYGERSSLLLLSSFWIAVVSIVLLQLYRHRPRHPISFSWHLVTKDLRIVERGIVALPCLLLFTLFASAFTSIKTAISHIHRFRFDPMFADLDKLLHGGHAWELIHPIVAFPIVTFGLNILYDLWFFIVWFAFALVTVMIGDRRLREQYLLSFFACWILLGSIAAIGFSSAGPCFYGRLYANDPYAPLMSYLRSVNESYPLWVLSTQEMLWNRYLSNSTGLGSGISAMPSLHVAIAALNAIMLSKLSRAAGLLGWAYLLVILVGSVHLGWHYAIDGYVSIIAVLVIWRAAGWWARRGLEPAPVAVAI